MSLKKKPRFEVREHEAKKTLVYDTLRRVTVAEAFDLRLDDAEKNALRIARLLNNDK